jgi:hypothetical protein
MFFKKQCGIPYYTVRRILLVFIVIGRIDTLNAQELYPYSEAASTQPKNVLGFHLGYENYKELPSNRARLWNELKFIYGIRHNLTASLSITGSNHHTKTFPNDISGFFKNHHQISYPQNPYQLEGIILTAKYRFLTIDRRQRHLRMAILASAAKSFVPHIEAEARLGDNSGVEGTWITTLLLKRFAISLNPGIIAPTKYQNKDNSTTFQYSTVKYINVSLGYRLIPSKYSDYNNLNLNLYLEVTNRWYGNAVLTVNDQPYSFDQFQNYDRYIYNGLQSNFYSEIRPSIQLVFFSKTRLNLGVAQSLYGQSYLHFYPLYFVTLQTNIESKKKYKQKK